MLVVNRYQAHKEPVSERGRDDANEIAVAAARTRRPVNHWTAHGTRTDWKHVASPQRTATPRELCPLHSLHPSSLKVCEIVLGMLLHAMHLA